MSEEAEKERDYLYQMGGLAVFVLLSLLFMPVVGYFTADEVSDEKQVEAMTRLDEAEEGLRRGTLLVAKRSVDESYAIAPKRRCSEALATRRQSLETRINSAIEAQRRLRERVCDNLDQLPVLREHSPTLFTEFEALAKGCTSERTH